MIETVSYHDLLSTDSSVQVKVQGIIKKAFSFEDSLGIIAVEGVPNLLKLRDDLLPLSAKLANLPTDDLTAIERPEVGYMVGWSRGKEMFEGKPDTHKGSFYANPLLDDPKDVTLQDADDSIPSKSFGSANVWPSQALPELEPAFKSLGHSICSVASLILTHCNAIVHSQMPSTNPIPPVPSATTSGEASGAAGPSRQPPDARAPSPQSTACAPPSSDPSGTPSPIRKRTAHLLLRPEDQKSCKGRLLHYYSVEPGEQGLWCGWHTDFGTLTGLTSSMYLPQNEPPTAAAALPVPEPGVGLQIKSRSGAVVPVAARPDQLLFQAGRALQVVSGGLFRATEHCVQAPRGQHAVTRNTFAVFCQPNAEDVLKPLDGLSADETVENWHPGITFGEFADQTLPSSVM